MKMKPLYKKCLLRMVLFLGYALLGGWLFSLVEKTEEPNTVTSSRLLNNLKMEMKVKYNMSNSTDFYKFVEAAYKLSKLRRKLDWTFFSGCSFAMSALITVGYGDITPQTPIGQGLTMPFCLIGLPITMLALKTAGEVVLVALKRLQVGFERRILCRKNPKSTILKSFFMVAFGITFLIGVLAIIVVYFRGWTFTEGVYCWFITFTTIGFGDYVAINIDNELYNREQTTTLEILDVLTMLLFTIPYITGFCLISSLLNLLVDWSEKINVNLKFCGMCSIRVKNRKKFCMSETTPNHPMARNNPTDLSLKSLSFRRCSL